MSVFTAGHALIIGVGSDLPNTVADAEGIATILTNPELCAYPTEQVHLLTEKQATRTELLAALDRLAENAGPESTIVIYFSGHGYEINTGIGLQYFLMPNGYDVANLTTTAISGAEVTSKFAAIKAQKMLVLFDCCHAGGLDESIMQKSPGVQFTKSPLPQDAVDELSKGIGRVIIASCKKEEKSYTGNPYSQFTQALVESLSGEENAKQDGFVTVSDLAMYAAKTVPRYTNDLQNPILNFDESNNFAVAYYAGGETKPKGLPSNAKRKPFDVEAENAEPSSGPSVSNTGSGGAAIGDRNKVGGKGSVIADTIHGNVATGENARQISTETYIERQEVDNSSTDNSSVFNQSGQTVGKQINVPGDVRADQGLINLGEINTDGGEVVAGNKIVGEDEVRGDKHDIDSVTARNVAIGRGAQVNEQTNDAPIDNLQQVLTQIIVAAAELPGEESSEAVQKANDLKSELISASQPDDKKVARLIDGLVGLLPDETEHFHMIHNEPAFRERTGQFSQFVLEGIVGS
ncbi:MAG: caspase family protein [Chloroflexota bacterium]